MVQKDLYNDIAIIRCLDPVVGTDDTALVGAIQDHAGYGSITYAILNGVLSDANATFTVLIEDGNASNLSDAAAVADEYLLGTEAGASFIFSDDSETKKIGYNGPKRYSRMTITPSGNTGNVPIGAVCIKGHPMKAPLTSQG